jgi:dihydrofolate synthase / folylpolyglutamate synthase
VEDDAERRALAWLFGFADMERGVGWNPRASADEQWKLGRTRALLDLAGAPDRRLRVVLVGGTKGKGSTAAWLTSILHAHGRRVGLYSKPHLQTYRERVRVDGVAISPAQLEAATRRGRRLVERLRRRHPDAGEPTTFELTTVLALDHFARSGCGVAVVEVGLGGRLDATNATEPEVSVITPISRDHTAILGNSLAAIATEKAGILRPGRPGLLAEQRPTARAALARRCRQIGARCETVPPLALPVHLPLAGDYQRQNAGLAVAAARALAPVTDAEMRCGLERLRWPGRFEIVGRAPAVVLDGAHNDASAAALASTLRAFAAGRPVQLVLGINRDKDARAVLRPLLALAAGVWPTTTGGPRARLPGELAALCRRYAPRRDLPVAVCRDVATALAAARTAAGPTGVVCVTGSLALVGQARGALGLSLPEALWDAPA